MEDFETQSNQKFPKGWSSRGGAPEEVYKVHVEDFGNHFLRAIDLGQSVQLFKKKLKWKIREYPNLSWRWRVHAFPQGANEMKGETNDSAAGVYVVFRRGLFDFRSIKYIWSQQVTKETIIRRRYKYPMIVIRSQLDCKQKNECKEEWFWETRNVALDYEKLFKKKPPKKPYAIGVLTDANASFSPKPEPYYAQADYDDFRVLKVTKEGLSLEKNTNAD